MHNSVSGVICILAGGKQIDENEENSKEEENDQNFNYGLGVSLAVIAALLSGSYKILYKFYFKSLNFGQCCYSLAIIGFLGKRFESRLKF